MGFDGHPLFPAELAAVAAGRGYEAEGASANCKDFQSVGKYCIVFTGMEILSALGRLLCDVLATYHHRIAILLHLVLFSMC